MRFVQYLLRNVITVNTYLEMYTCLSSHVFLEPSQPWHINFRSGLLLYIFVNI